MPTRAPSAAAPTPVRDPSGAPAADTWTLSTRTVHLNHGSFGAVPTAVSEYQSALVEEMNSIPGDWFTALPRRVGAARARIAAFLGAAEEDTALVPNASAGVSVVLNSLDLPAGAEILLTDHAYGAVHMAAERAVRRVGGRVRVAPVELNAAADDTTRAVVDAVDDRTALVIVDQITSATARLLPVAAIATECRRRGVPVLVDAAHAPGMLARPLEDNAADYWVGNLHKWGCAPRGTAALVASERVADSLHPLIDSWGAPDPYPVRFDTQGTIDLSSYLAAPRSLDLIEELFGWDAARRYMGDLADYAEDVIARAFESLTGEPATVDVGMPVPAMRLLALPSGLATTPAGAHELRDRVAALGFQTAMTSWRGTGYLRLSAHVYNLAAEYDRFAEVAVPHIVALAHES
ncbi:aminotransferase class V-fold PLP-dependent enzyme [Microbacteriaceae bacterium 4G12]